MTITSYPHPDLESEEIWRRLVTEAREQDIVEWINLDNRFVAGRVVSRAAPSSATDTAAGDTVGDIVRDATYEYKLLDISGTLKWDRRALDVSW